MSSAGHQKGIVKILHTITLIGPQEHGGPSEAPSNGYTVHPVFVAPGGFFELDEPLLV